MDIGFERALVLACARQYSLVSSMPVLSRAVARGKVFGCGKPGVHRCTSIRNQTEQIQGQG